MIKKINLKISPVELAKKLDQAKKEGKDYIEVVTEEGNKVRISLKDKHGMQAVTRYDRMD